MRNVSGMAKFSVVSTESKESHSDIHIRLDLLSKSLSNEFDDQTDGILKSMRTMRTLQTMHRGTSPRKANYSPTQMKLSHRGNLTSKLNMMQQDSSMSTYDKEKRRLAEDQKRDNSQFESYITSLNDFKYKRIPAKLHTQLIN